MVIPLNKCVNTVTVVYLHGLIFYSNVMLPMVFLMRGVVSVSIYVGSILYVFYVCMYTVVYTNTESKGYVNKQKIWFGTILQTYYPTAIPPSLL